MSIVPARPVELPRKPVDNFRLILSTATVALVLWSILRLDIKWSRLLEAPRDLYRLGKAMFTNMEAAESRGLIAAMCEVT